jgi:hypothetical protein
VRIPAIAFIHAPPHGLSFVIDPCMPTEWKPWFSFMIIYKFPHPHLTKWVCALNASIRFSDIVYEQVINRLQ